jgi:hypothetical protein
MHLLACCHAPFLLLVKYVDCQLEGFAFLFLHFQQKVMRFDSFFSVIYQNRFPSKFFNKKINPTRSILAKQTNQTQTDVLTFPCYVSIIIFNLIIKTIVTTNRCNYCFEFN